MPQLFDVVCLGGGVPGEAIAVGDCGRRSAGENVDFETLHVRREGAVLFVAIAAPPMNLLGTELVRDLVSHRLRSSVS